MRIFIQQNLLQQQSMHISSIGNCYAKRRTRNLLPHYRSAPRICIRAQLQILKNTAHDLLVAEAADASGGFRYDR
jgi:hypothetical protein